MSALSHTGNDMEDTSGPETPMDDFERDTLNYIRHCFNTFRNLGLSPEEAVAKLVDRPGLPLIDLTWKEAEFISFLEIKRDYKNNISFFDEEGH